MGIRLIVEVLDHWQDVGLTAGERDDLLVIAENANEWDRETRGPIHEPYILRRANKSARGWRNAIGKLMKKKVLEYAVRNGREVTGHSGQHAVYRLPVLCPDPPHDGWLGYCTRPERVTSQVTQSEDPAQEKGHLSDDPISEKGHLSDANGSPDRCERVTSQVTPTPLTPLTPLTTAAGKPASGQRKPSKRQVADDLTAAFWKRHGKGRAQSFVAVRSVIRTAVGNGVERDDLARALDQVAREGRSISGGTLDTALGNLRRTNGWQRPGGHRPYSDPDNQDEYDGDI